MKTIKIRLRIKKSILPAALAALAIAGQLAMPVDVQIGPRAEPVACHHAQESAAATHCPINQKGVQP